MKKQILFMTFMSLAFLFAGVSNLYGQLPITEPQLTGAPTYCPPAIPVAAICGAAGPLSPIPGTPYDYTIAVTNGGTADIHWFVTTDEQFLNGGVLTTDIELVANSNYIQAAGTTYNDPDNISPTVKITWKSFPTTDDVFLVTYVINEAGCTDNIEVYKIEPVHVFTLDIATLTAAGGQNTTNSDCVSPVQSAIWNGTEVEMDYGVNYIYFAVNAANFAHSWTPSFELAVTNTTASTILNIDWAYPDESYAKDATTPAVWNGTDLADGKYTSSDAVFPTTEGATGVGAAGECIIVRVTVDHNKNETLADMAITLAVDGIMYDFSTGAYTTNTLGDVHHDTGVTNADNCTGVDNFDNDIATYTLTRRPTVTATDPIPFLDKDSE